MKTAEPGTGERRRGEGRSLMLLLYVERDDHEPIVVDSTPEVVIPMLAKWQEVDRRYTESLIDKGVDASDWCSVQEWWLVGRGIGIIVAPALYLDDVGAEVSA